MTSRKIIKFLWLLRILADFSLLLLVIFAPDRNDVVSTVILLALFHSVSLPQIRFFFLHFSLQILTIVRRIWDVSVHTDRRQLFTREFFSLCRWAQPNRTDELHKMQLKARKNFAKCTRRKLRWGKYKKPHEINLERSRQAKWRDQTIRTRSGSTLEQQHVGDVRREITFFLLLSNFLPFFSAEYINNFYLDQKKPKLSSPSHHWRTRSSTFNDQK